MTAHTRTIGIGITSLRSLAAVAETLGIELIILSEGLAVESLGESCAEYLIPWTEFTATRVHEVMLNMAEEELKCS
jgi:hypothetical protein